VTEPSFAVIVVLPVATLLASPWPLIVATAALDEVQRTDPVTSCLLASLNVPVAVNCLVVPTAMLELAGVTASETKVAPVTMRVAVPFTEPEVAVMVVVPVPRLVAKPVGSTVATPLDDEDQESDVSNCVLPSSKLPTALNCSVVPMAIDGVAGVTAIASRWAATTVKVVLSVSVPMVAVMVVEPGATVVTRPEPLTVATLVEDEVHVTPLTRS
jgi:hypothetical protein